MTNQVRLSLAGTSAARASGGSAAAPCGAGATACTPDNLAGRIFSGNVMWGELGAGAFGITVIGADDDVIRDPSHGMGGVLEFSLIDSTTLAGAHASPGAGSEGRIVPRMEFNYDYLDATLTVAAGSPVDETYVVRTVFVTEATASDVSGTMHRGDKLVRRADEPMFRWCGASACAAERDAVSGALVQEAKLVDYVDPGDGNPAYVPFAIPLANEVRLTGDELATPGSTWSVAFDMTNAVVLGRGPETFATEADLVAAFELSYSPDQQHGGEMTDIAVELTYVRGE